MPNEKPFKLDMPFGEALRRLAQTDPKELPEGARLRGKHEQREKERAGRDSPDPPEKMVPDPQGATGTGNPASGRRRARSAPGGDDSKR
jgi:hypothetical protein